MAIALAAALLLLGQALVCEASQQNSQPTEKTTLHRAAESGNIEAVKQLLASGADVNSKNPDGNTALHESIIHGHFDVATLLIAQRADVNARNSDGLSPLHLAAGAGREITALDMFDKRGQYNPNWSAKPAGYESFRGQSEFVGFLIAKGGDPNAKTATGLTPLMLALHRKYGDIASHLVLVGADVNAATVGGNRPLVMAIGNGDPEICRLLLLRGADVNARVGEQKETPLMLAAQLGNVPVIKELLWHGARIADKDATGKAALDYAKTAKAAEVLKNAVFFQPKPTPQVAPAAKTPSSGARKK